MGNSVEVAPILSAREGRWSLGLPSWQGVVLLLLLAWLYAPILVRLFLQWVGPSRDPNFEHGIFVPIFAFFVLWQNRAKLNAIAPAPSWSGLPLVMLSLLMLILGVLGAELFFSRVSLLILLAGLIILFQGWTFFRAVLFPWAFLFLMVPIPSLILQQVTFPLQLLAAKLATALLDVVGVPVLRQGNVIVSGFNATGRGRSLQWHPFFAHLGHARDHVWILDGNSHVGAGDIGGIRAANCRGG